MYAFESSILAAPTEEQLVLEEGTPLFRNFLPKEYRASAQNWAIAQTPEGMIYVGNSDGVMEFDGVNWRLIPINNQTIARSLAVDPHSGRVYVGAVGELGYLEADGQGKMQYVSMLEKIDAAERDFADVWRIHFTPQGVYFTTFKRLFRFNKQEVKSWDTDTSFHLSFLADNRIFIREVSRGLMELIDDELVLLPETERFENERIYGLVTFPDENSSALLIVTRQQGLFVYQDNTLRTLKTQIDEQLKKDLIYAVARLPDGRLALCTLQGGIHLIDNSGKWLNTFSSDDGLPDNSVTSAKVDNEGGIWFTSLRGISRFSAGNAITYFNELAGLKSGAFVTKRFKGNLYAGGNQGLFVLKQGANAHFTPVPGVQNQVWDIQAFQERLLLANYLGVYELVEGEAKLVFPYDAVFALHAGNNSNRVFIATRRGLASMRLENGRWINEGYIEGIEEEIRSIWQLKNGDLWLGTYTNELMRVKFIAGKALQVSQVGVAQGLPNNTINQINSYQGKPILLTNSGIYIFDENEQKFNLDPRFIQLFGEQKPQYLAAASDPERGLWLITSTGENRQVQSGLAARQPDGSFKLKRRMLVNLDKFRQEDIYRDPSGVLWISGSEGIFRVDPQKTHKDLVPFDVVLRKVSTGDGKVIYSGAGNSPILEIPFTDNRIRFEFAALTFNELDENSYQVRLTGADEHWSIASKEAFKDYSNLWEGNYELWLRAVNQQGVVQESKVYAFKVLPPWYRSLLAYFCYLFLLFCSVWLILHWRLGRVEAQQTLLRSQVDERTRQLAMLGKIGRDITAKLDLDLALESVYMSTNSMLDAHIFGIGLYHPEKHEIEFRLAIEDGQRYKPYVRKMQDKNQLAVWCVDHKEIVVIGDFKLEYSRYIPSMESHTAILDNGITSTQPVSVLYVPILLQQLVIGVLTVQSFEAHAYRPEHVELLQTLASYTAIAIDNGRAHAELLVAYKTMEEFSVTDQLTGLKNRHFLKKHIENDIDEISRYYSNRIRNGKEISADELVHLLFIIDLDHFKLVNDTYGHAAGDLVLIQIKVLLGEVFRESDFLIRWGGEEFLTIARFTRKSTGKILAERLRSVIERHEFDIGEGKKISMTASIGFTAYPFYGNAHQLLTWQEVVKIADQCLYYAKNNQRNAWVGAAAVEGLSTEELVELIQNEPELLLNNSYIELTTSITKKASIT